MASRPAKIQDLPTDESVTLQPTKILYLHPFRKHSSPSPILDLTPYFQNFYDGDITSVFQEQVQKLLKADPTIQATWNLQKTTTEYGHNTRITITAPPSTATTATDGDEHISLAGATNPDQLTTAQPLAYINSHLLSYGASHIHFLPTDNTSHDITVKAVSVWCRAQTFVKDSATYIWERTNISAAKSRSSDSSNDHRHRCYHSRSGRLSLYKALAGKRVEVARYASTSGKFEFGGLLLFEESEVEPLVAILTLLGVLAQTDAYYMPGLHLVSKRMAKHAQ